MLDRQKSGLQFGIAKTGQVSGGNGRQGIIDVVAANDRNGNVKGTVEAAAGKTNPFFVTGDVLGPDMSRIIGPVEDRPALAEILHGCDKRIVTI